MAKQLLSFRMPSDSHKPGLLAKFRGGARRRGRAASWGTSDRVIGKPLRIDQPEPSRFGLVGVVGALGRDPTPYSGSITPPPSYPLRVGSRSSSVTGLFNGCLDEVQAIQQALTQDEVLSHFQSATCK